MNKKSVTQYFFISVSSILTFISSSSLTFFFSIFLVPAYFRFLMSYFRHTHFLTARKQVLVVAARLSVCDCHSLLWQRTSVFIVVCDGSTPLCLWLSSLVVTTRPGVSVCHRLWCQHASESMFISFIVLSQLSYFHKRCHIQNLIKQILVSYHGSTNMTSFQLLRWNKQIEAFSENDKGTYHRPVSCLL